MKKTVTAQIDIAKAQRLAVSCGHLQNKHCPVCWLDGDKEPSVCCAFCANANQCVHMELDLWANDGCPLVRAKVQ